MSVSKLNGVTWSGISKVNGVAKANIARVSSYLVTAGGGGDVGGGGGGPVSTKSVVYDGVDATSRVRQAHTFTDILNRSTRSAATISIWVNLQDVTNTTSFQYIFGNVYSAGGGGDFNTLTIKRSSSSNPSNVIVRADNYSASLKQGAFGAYRKEVETTTGVTDDWIHICLVVSLSASGTSYDTSIFINGSLASDTSTTLSYTQNTSLVRNDVGLGSALDTANTVMADFSEMKLSDYIIWADKLTSSEITDIYNAGVGEFDPSTNSGNYTSKSDLEIHYEVGNTAEDTTEAPVTNNTGTSGNLVHTNVEFASL